MTILDTFTTPRAAAAAVLLAAGLTLTACAGGTGNSTPAGSAQEGGTHQQSQPTSAAHNEADTGFAQAMIVHHQQALDMSESMLGKKDVPQSVTTLAQRIKGAQGPEIASMTAWLKAWNEPVEMSSGHAGHSMEGMLSEEELAKLDAAQGKEAARMFLTQMIAHHEGAVTMAKDQAANGKDHAAVKLANAIVTAQQAEIKEMRELLATLG
ncbi:DUF305 domain-containing protein [Arthrobacter silvisoli]|uniref:DUF305 domain-containing protein n=1 Tax=Arthrobacter silvisoli TaxID=2291022 RepID=UPI000E2145F5|nr:DUF305 domain-containing protein [Arthrobacter silvisoli]